jgi:hypothetical protein
MMSVEHLVEWELAGETCPTATLSTTNPTWSHLGSNPGRRGGKTVTNRLTALQSVPCSYYIQETRPHTKEKIYVRLKMNDQFRTKVPVATTASPVPGILVRIMQGDAVYLDKYTLEDKWLNTLNNTPETRTE